MSEQKVTEMFNTISPTYDKVNTVLSFGFDRLWRKAMIKSLPKKAKLSLLDVATGTGEVIYEAFRQNAIEMAVGIDLSNQMLQVAEEKFARSPYKPQVNFIEASALELPLEDKTFDAVTISYGIRNTQNPELALKEMLRVLKPGGHAAVLEFSLPNNPLLKKLHLVYLRKFLPKIGSFLSKSKTSYTYLNKTIEGFPYGSQFLKLMENAGFKSCTSQPLFGGITTLYTGNK